MASTSTSGRRSIIDEILRSIGRHSIPTTLGDSNIPELPTAKRNTSTSSNARHNSDVKRLLVTLHFFFPHELLPALDLIDRGLVRCFVLKDANSKTGDGDDKPGDSGGTTETETSTGTAGNIAVVGKESNETTVFAMTGKSALSTPRRPSPPKENSNITIQCRNPEVEVWYVQSASAITDNRSHPIKNPSRPNVVGGSSLTRGAGGGGQGQGRYRDALRATNTFYEVRLDSWNCSCAAFAFGGLKALGSGMERSTTGRLEEGGGEQGQKLGAQEVEGGGRGGKGVAGDIREWNWAFGGTATKLEYGVPVTVCKHILAALIAKAAPGLCGGDGTGLRREVSGEEMAGWAAGWGDCG